jgi:hypothetical protein
MKKNLLIGKVAALGRDMEKLYSQGRQLGSAAFGDSDIYNSLLSNIDDEGSAGESMTGPQILRSMKGGLSSMSTTGILLSSDITGSQQVKISQLLGAFEEPESVDSQNVSCHLPSSQDFPYPMSHPHFSLAGGC